MVQPDIDEDVVVDLDFEPVIACEGRDHNRGMSGHIPDAPGAFMVISPCHGPKVIQCAPRVAAMRFSGLLHCSVCRMEHLVEEYRFLPIKGE
ncbi:hypothetical protein [Cryobacterium fucosi]|uniref:Uncharacterized protein n=1 Tax=Cryobacterium fucosi TaxID=1259157 RepID=A0A4R9B3I1_9MICO|nr:hypothetical protein [Cryobacterium fucosi]TFD74720.1 hypothetical protein E3T48_12405 [Cryobacterium fucosi]